MTAIFDSMHALPHAHHLPSDLSDPLSDDFRRAHTNPNEEIIRSASFTALSALQKCSTFDFEKESLQSFSLDDLSLPSPTKTDGFNDALDDALSIHTAKSKKKVQENKQVPEEKQELEKKPIKKQDWEKEQERGEEQEDDQKTSEEQKNSEKLRRRRTLLTRPKSWILQVKVSQESRASQERSRGTMVVEAPPMPPVPKMTLTKSKGRSKSFASYARVPWMASSRSPSPNKKDAERNSQEDESTPPSSISSSSSRTSSATPTTKEPEKKEPATPINQSPAKRAANFLQKKRPRSALFSKSADSSSVSINRLSHERRDSSHGSTEKLPALPQGLDADKPIESTRRKDELWSVFRSLDTDYSKFQAKTSAMKTQVVRASLLPFLKNTAQHPSNKTIRPEDLDRRINILNKWWTGLIETLEGRSSQMVSGLDRPVLLDAVTLIMCRPEWRLPPSQFAPLSDQTFGTASRNTSSGSLNTSASQFLAESVYHNVRNMFVQNLLAQMHLVVDKMSLRQTPASLVTFCGKATAYAFFFCPGVADVLIKAWELSAPILRRVVDEFGISRRASRSDFLEDLTTTFPSNLRLLTWVSVPAMVKQLRRPANLPLGAAKIAWFGPWVTRWRGRDSDLFFVFCKYYHILAEEFMPVHLSLAEKARAPGFVLVHAQILSLMDATIHRQSSPDQLVNGPLPITFDDVLAGADASVAVLPLPSNNATRLMAENRLIMLLRDFLSEKSSEFEVARTTFAQTFSRMARAAAKRTSQYDNNGCLTLCDFMDEALAIYMRFQSQTESSTDYIDWTFWLAVCKKMLESHNIMTEMRLFSLIYGAWNVIVSDPRRKEVACMDWLLAPDTFEKHFCHWCPMVRAYFMRLLCWRVARFEGEASALDTKIYKTLLDRLKTTWVQYTLLRQESEISSKPIPSTAPCYPAPGRRLLIVRNDSHPPTNLFIGFDGIVAPNQMQSSLDQPVAIKRNSLASLTRLQIGEAAPAAYESASSTNGSGHSTPVKKRWNGLLGKILPFGNSDTEQTMTPTPPSAPPTQLGSPMNSPQSPVPPFPSFPQSKMNTTLSRSSSKSNLRSTSKDSDTSALAAARQETSLRRRNSKAATPGSHSSNSSTDSIASARSLCTFKFSLEWANNAANNGVGSNGGFGKERRLWDPKLPGPAQGYLNSRGMGISGVGINLGNGYIVGGVDGKDGSVKDGREGNEVVYAGRALSEWALTIQECNNFGERRRGEGVAGWKWIEVPMLGVEGFKKYT